MQIRVYILQCLLVLLPMAVMAQALPASQTEAGDGVETPEMLHQEIANRMMMYVEELNELALVSSMHVSFQNGTPLTLSYVDVLRSKVNTLEERYKSVDIRWRTFTQAMQMDIADDDELMAILSNVEQMKQAVADTIAAKQQQCNALQDFARAEASLAGQDTVFKNLYDEAFKLSLIKKLAPRLEKLKAREQALFAQLQQSYQKAQQACQTVPALESRLPALDETFANIQMASAKIQQMTYKPFIQRIKDYLIGLACVAVLLLFANMVTTRIKQFKNMRQQAKQYNEMMQRNGGGGQYPTI